MIIRFHGIKILYNFAEELRFDDVHRRIKGTRERSLVSLLYSEAIRALDFYRGLPDHTRAKSRWMSTNPNHICKELNLLFQKNAAGNISNKIGEDVISIEDKLVEQKCISIKQHKFLLLPCFNSKQKYQLDRKVQNLIIKHLLH